MRQLKIIKSITPRDSDSLERYLQEIDKEDLLTPEQEVELAIKIKQGDQNALDKFVKANLRFVVSVAKMYQYQNHSLQLQDLINEGNFGLTKAALKFDHTKGFKFISYAVWWIRQTIMLAIANDGRMVRLPLNIVGSIGKMNKAKISFEQREERDPTPDELAEILEEDIAKICELEEYYKLPVSMDGSGSPDDDEDHDLHAKLPGDSFDSFQSKFIKLGVNDYLKKTIREHISERDAGILFYYYGLADDCSESLTLEAIADRLGITRERVRQIRDKSEKKLKKIESFANKFKTST